MNSNKLKWTALIFMLIDHIGEFVPNTPLVFRWIGRLSAPIFLFCCVWSFVCTRDRKKYMVRLYAAGVLMSIIQSVYDIPNNFFRTLFSLCLILYLLEMCKSKKKYFKYLFIYFGWQLISIIITIFLIQISSGKAIDIFVYIFPALCGNIFYLEGGFIFVLLGILFYLFKDNIYKLTISFILYDVIYFFVSTTSIISIVLGKLYAYGLSIVSDCMEYILDTIIGLPPSTLGGSPLFINYQWLMIFSLFFMLIYNGKEGKKHKLFFYIFYPAHILIFCLIYGVN
jgi:hypothetical protein